LYIIFTQGFSEKSKKIKDKQNTEKDYENQYFLTEDKRERSDIIFPGE